MKQVDFDAIGIEINGLIDQLKGGLITLTEFLDATGNIKKYLAPTDDWAGLVCPFSGLRYPTLEETDEFIKAFVAIART